MGRIKKIEKGYEKVKRAIAKMEKSRSLEYTSELVKISEKLTIEIQCQRVQPEESAFDGAGRAYGFELYAIVNGVAEDCCCDHDSIDEDIKYLLECWC